MLYSPSPPAPRRDCHAACRAAPSSAEDDEPSDDGAFGALRDLSVTAALTVAANAASLSSRRAAFSFAMFSDGSFQGSSRTRDVVMRRRVQAEREATFWIGTIDKVAAGSPADAARRLSIYTEARSKYDDVSLTALAAFGIPELIKAAEQNPAGFSEAAAATRAGLVASRDALALRLAQPRTPR
jgi:hypothetical protein